MIPSKNCPTCGQEFSCSSVVPLDTEENIRPCTLQFICEECKTAIGYRVRIEGPDFHEKMRAWLREMWL
ncbi:MAG: hypothetical protein H6Q65_1151 [Firmicutes bacterium]|nr:hypothetical protein [Bacillota bacterium]